MAKLFKILVPSTMNSGETYNAARSSFEGELLARIGGFTRGDMQQGQWKDQGRVYVDGVFPYEVSCSQSDYKWMVERFFAIFDDQKAVFTAEIGVGHIITRPN